MTPLATHCRPGCSPRIAGRLAACLIPVALGACSPALDWRQVRPEGWGLQATMPCRPDQQQRQVALAGAPVALSLVVCSTEGHSFALASADVGDPARVAPALQALLQAAQANVQGQVLAEQPAAVPGMTPHAGAVRRQLAGRMPDGRVVREQVQVFAHGLRVFQATVVGPEAGPSQAGPFFEAIELRR